MRHLNLILIALIIPFLSVSQECYDLEVKFDPVLFSFCDDDNNCLSFDIYADNELYQSISLDTIDVNQVYNLCINYNSSCNFTAQFGGEFNGFTDLMYFQIFEEDGSSQFYNYGDQWQVGSFCGCTYFLAENFNPEAIIDDGSCIAYGCTNPEAENYDSLATIENGSCLIFGCTDLESFNYNPDAEFDDGSCVDYVYGCIDSNALNYNTLANTDDGSCSYCQLDVSIFSFNPTTSSSCDGFISLVFDGQEPYSVNWSNNSTENTLSLMCNGVYTFEAIDNNNCFVSEEIILTNYVGCTDQLAINYDNTALIDDGSCEEYVFGCTDSTNVNYNPLANFDDGSCESCILNVIQFQTIDNTINDCDGQAFIVASSPYENEINYLWSNGATGSFTSGLCVGEYSVEIYDSTGCNITQNFTIGNVVYGCTNSESLNYDSTATIDDQSCIAIIEGCMDESANNYDETANFSTECTYDVYGCMDSLATNFNPSANIELNNCIYPCEENEVIIVMYDNLGNGWGSGFYRIQNSLGVSVSVGTLEEGSYGKDTLCLPSDCYSFDVLGAGIGSVEILWEIVFNGITISTGTGQSDYNFTLNQCAVYGCTDLSADNFDSDATANDGSCIYTINGCTDASAVNYDDEATIDDGSCQYENSLACNITPSGLFVDNIIHNRVIFNWSAPSVAPSHYMIRYRPLGTNSWTVMTAGPVNSNSFTGTSRTRYFMQEATTYEWSIRARVLNEDGSMDCQSSWSESDQYTTLPKCANLENLSTITEANWVNFSADAPDESWGVWQSKGKLRVTGTNSFRYMNGLSDGNISSLKGNFEPNTDYEWHTKAWCTGNVDADGNPDAQYHSGWGDFSAFTTQELCDKMPINLTTSSNAANSAISMSWDLPPSGTPDHYFLELTNLDTDQSWAWNNLDGESTSKTKFGLTAGNYSWRIRGACGTNGTSWATIFSQEVNYTLGGERLTEQSTVITVYPNPSRGIFNLELNNLTSEDIKLFVFNSMGQIVFSKDMLINENKVSIDLDNQSNGIYNLRLTTGNEIINQVLIKQ